MPPGRRTRGREARIGVNWRKDTEKFVVEMRPRSWKMKLNFGSHDTEPEAMVARDYGAFLRAAAGEDSAAAGGFDAVGKLYQFEELREIFESMEEMEVRLEQYRRLGPQYWKQPKEKWSGVRNPPHKEFCIQARKDIAVAIRKFRERYPHKLVASRSAETAIQDVPEAELLDDGIRSTQPSSCSGVGVSSALTLGGELEAVAGDGASFWKWRVVPVMIAVAVNGSPYQILLDMEVDGLSDDEVSKTVQASIGKVRVELDRASLKKLFEDVPACSINPVSIPFIDSVLET